MLIISIFDVFKIIDSGAKDTLLYKGIVKMKECL